MDTSDRIDVDLVLTRRAALSGAAIVITVVVAGPRDTTVKRLREMPFQIEDLL